jgi:acetate kinase
MADLTAPAHTHGFAGGRSVIAVLGPTNTGKTHLAIERMLGHESGLIGLSGMMRSSPVISATRAGPMRATILS